MRGLQEAWDRRLIRMAKAASGQARDARAARGLADEAMAARGCARDVKPARCRACYRAQWAETCSGLPFMLRWLSWGNTSSSPRGDQRAATGPPRSATGNGEAHAFIVPPGPCYHHGSLLTATGWRQSGQEVQRHPARARARKNGWTPLVTLSTSSRCLPWRTVPSSKLWALCVCVCQ
jgi:hypothetical protein